MITVTVKGQNAMKNAQQRKQENENRNQRAPASTSSSAFQVKATIVEGNLTRQKNVANATILVTYIMQLTRSFGTNVSK